MSNQRRSGEAGCASHAYRNNTLHLIFFSIRLTGSSLKNLSPLLSCPFLEFFTFESSYCSIGRLEVRCLLKMKLPFIWIHHFCSLKCSLLFSCVIFQTALRLVILWDREKWLFWRNESLSIFFPMSFNVWILYIYWIMKWSE